MRWTDLYVSSAAAWLPPAVEVDDWVALGMVDLTTAEESGIVSIRAAGADEPPAEMTITAARTALERSDHHAGEVALLLHATTFYQGIQGWSVASYIQRHAIGRHGLASEVRQGCNGAMFCLEIAASFLQLQDRRAAAVVTTGENFNAVGHNRWAVDANVVFADGATALVLSRYGGAARVLSTATFTDPDLEHIHRGGGDYYLRPALTPNGVHRAGDYDEPPKTASLSARMKAGSDTAVRTALADAGLDSREVKRWVLMNARRPLFESMIAQLGTDIGATNWEIGRTVGHLGAGDQILGLSHLLESHATERGDRIAILSAGSGFSWTCVVLEMTR
jgi:3-oxoacyl-[acyl-carrier-protein] synthase-3